MQTVAASAASGGVRRGLSHPEADRGLPHGQSLPDDDAAWAPQLTRARFNFGERRATFTSQNLTAVASNISGSAFFGRELFSPVIRTTTRYEWTDSLSLIKGNLIKFKFGGDFALVNPVSRV